MRPLLLLAFLIPQICFADFVYIPSSGGSGITSLNGQTGATQTFASGSTGTAPAFVSAGNTHTLNIPLASGVGVTSGTISKTDYDSFSAKVSGPGSSTNNAIAIWSGTGGTSIANSTLTYDGSSLSKTTDGTYTIGTAAAGRPSTVFSSLRDTVGTLGTNALSAPVLFASVPVFAAGASGNNAGAIFDVYGTGVGAEIGQFRARGTNTVPTAVQNGDTLGVFSATGFNGTTWQIEAARRNYSVTVTASENYTTSAMGTQVVERTISNGSIVPTARRVIDGTGVTNFRNGFVTQSELTNLTSNVATAYNIAQAARPTFYTASATQAPGFASEMYNNTGGEPIADSGSVAARVVLRRARGTNTAPAAVQNGDALGVQVFGGHDGSIFVNAGIAKLVAAEDWSATNHGNLYFIATIKNGPGEVLGRRIVVDGNGDTTVTGNFFGSLGATIGSSGLSSVNAPPPFNDGLLQIGSEGHGSFPSSIVETGSSGASGDNPAHINFVYSPDGTNIFTSNIQIDETTYNLSYVTSGTAFNFHSNIVAADAGNGIQIKEGANARMGRDTLVAGTVTVSNTSVTANTEIQVTCQDPNGGTPGTPYISARTPGVSFDITSTSGADTCIEAWQLIEPAP